MPKPKKIVIVAGEESGDIHAAKFIKELKQTNPDIELSGIGGQRMAACGVKIINDLANYGVTGLTEVFKHIFKIKQAFKDIQKHLKQERPDLLVLVDYPGFNLRLAKYAKQELGIKILYYISPQVWGWKMSRVNTIRDNVDKMAVILPFEKKLYAEANVPVEFVGHPLAHSVKVDEPMNEVRQQLNIRQDKLVCAMLPGSRKNEIKSHMPIMCKAAKILLKKHPNLHFVIPVAQSVETSFIEKFLGDLKDNFTLIRENTIKTVHCSDIAVVCSGTASFECALLAKPMCIIYRVSWLTYYAATKFILVKFLGLCNLLADKMVVPELLQYDCNHQELAKTVSELITNQEFTTKMVNNLQEIKQNLSTNTADISISKLIEQELA